MDYIWDLDGTLLDSYGVIVASLLETAAVHGVREEREDVLRAATRGSVTAYLKDLSSRTGVPAEALMRDYREISHRHTGEITRMPGAEETLRALRDAGSRHFVYTHRGSTSRGLLERLGLIGFFTEIVTSENGFAPKPSGDAVRYLIRKYALDPDSTAYVGDRNLDVGCAKDAGVRAILFLPEISCVEPAGQEDRIIRTLQELTENG